VNKRIALFLVCSIGLLMLGASFLAGPLPSAAQGLPTATPILLFTPTPTLGSEAVLQQVQRTNADTARQIENLTGAISSIQFFTILFGAIAILAVLFGVVVYADHRGNVGRLRDLFNNTVDETKRMRVVEEGVRIRQGDTEKLAQRVDTSLTSMQDDIRRQLQIVYETNDRQVKDLQTVVNNRLREMETLRGTLDNTAQLLQNTIRDQLQGVYERGDKQIKAVTDVLNAQMREIGTQRQTLDSTAQELRDTIRDQMQVIYDRGDKQTRDWVAALNTGLKDITTVRHEMEENHQSMRDQIRDGLTKVYERSDIQMKEVRALLDNRLKDFEALRAEIQLAANTMQERIRNEIQQARQSLADLEALRTEIDSEFENALTTLNTSTAERQQKAAQALIAAHVGEGHANRGNLTAATAQLKDAVITDPGNKVLRVRLADLLLRQGKITEAIQNLVAANAGSGELPDADALYGYALRLQGDMETDATERERAYSKATTILLKTMENAPALLDTDGESVYGALANLYRTRGQIAQALTFYDYLRKITPDSSYLTNNLGILNLLTGSTPTAQRWFEQSRQLAARTLNADRGNYWAWFDLITADVALGSSLDEIEKELGLAVALLPTPQALFKLVAGLDTLSRAQNAPINAAKVISKVKDYLRATPQA